MRYFMKVDYATDIQDKWTCFCVLLWGVEAISV